MIPNMESHKIHVPNHQPVRRYLNWFVNIEQMVRMRSVSWSLQSLESATTWRKPPRNTESTKRNPWVRFQPASGWMMIQNNLKIAELIDDHNSKFTEIIIQNNLNYDDHKAIWRWFLLL